MREIDLEGEVWRDFPIEEYKDFFEISSVGRIRSKVRLITRTNRFNTKYTQYVGGKILGERTNGNDPHVYSTIGFRHPDTGELYNKTVYPHKMVAMAFVPKPSKKLDKVTFKDRNPLNIVPDNLVWTNQSYLSTRNMVEHPINRNKLGAHQRKIGKPSRATKLKVIELAKKGFDVYTIGEKMGKSKSWGYTHVDDILKEEKLRLAKIKQSHSTKQS